MILAASVEEDLTDFLSEKVIAMEPGKLIVDKVSAGGTEKACGFHVWDDAWRFFY